MTILLLALNFLSPTASAQDVEGFVEVRGSWLVGVDGTPVQAVERFRPTLESYLDDDQRVLLSTTIETGLSQGRYTNDELQATLADSDLQPWLDFAGCTWPENQNSLFRIDSAGDYMSVDRLYLDWYHPKFDLRIGRQALQWGSAQFVNPTDPYPQVLVTQPWLPRAGVNAARFTIPVGDLNRIQGFVGMDDTFTRVRAAGRGTVNWLQTDWSLVTAYRQESDELLTGIDIKGTLGIGFWVEAALHFGEIFDADEELTLRDDLVVGIDYSFPVLQNFIVSAQYYRNGAGATHPDDYAAGGASTLTTGGAGGPECDQDLFGASGGGGSDPFAPFFSARDYGLVSVNLVIVEELSISAATLQNFDDGTGFAIPTIAVSPYRSLQVSLSGQIPYKAWGEGGEFKPRDEDLSLEVPISPDVDPIRVDLSGLVPDATVILWTRASF